MGLNHIVAMSQNRVIGVQGQLPWHIPEDFKFFKRTTMGHMMIMGRKTWDSIGRVLPGRKTIIVTRDSKFHAPEDVTLASSITEAFEFCRSQRDQWGDDFFVVGGGELYQQTIGDCERIYLTEVYKELSGDTFYPAIDPQIFRLISKEDHLDAPIPFSFQLWERRIRS